MRKFLEKFWVCALAAMLTISPCYKADAAKYEFQGGNITGLNPIAIDKDATSNGDYAISIGYYAKALANNAIAMGMWSQANGQDAYALGSNAHALADNSLAIGYVARATAENSVAIGYGAGSLYDYIGSLTRSVGENSTSVGHSAHALGQASTALGYYTYVYGDNSVAVGDNATVGTANTDVDDAVALGSNSKATESNTVSIGNNTTKRRLVNLAAGKADTDGVNVSQLKKLGTATANALGGDSEFSFSTSGNGTLKTSLKVGDDTYSSVQRALDALADGTVAYDGDDKSTVTLGGTNGTKITNVADGSADSDAVNFKQLSAVSEEAKNKGSWTLNAGESTNVIGDGDSITIAEGSNLKITAASGTYTFGVVDNPEFASVKIGDYTISHNNGLDMGGAVLDNVAAGSIADGSMQAVNGGQLFTTNTNLSNLGGSVASAFGDAWNYENGALSGEFTYNGSGTTLQGALDSISAKLDELSEGWYFEANDGGASGEAGTGAGESQIKPGDKLTVNAGEDINITQNGDKDYTISVDPNLREEIEEGYTAADSELKTEITEAYLSRPTPS